MACSDALKINLESGGMPQKNTKNNMSLTMAAATALDTAIVKMPTAASKPTDARTGYVTPTATAAAQLGILNIWGKSDITALTGYVKRTNMDGTTVTYPAQNFAEPSRSAQDNDVYTIDLSSVRLYTGDELHLVATATAAGTLNLSVEVNFL